MNEIENAVETTDTPDLEFLRVNMDAILSRCGEEFRPDNMLQGKFTFGKSVSLATLVGAGYLEIIDPETFLVRFTKKALEIVRKWSTEGFITDWLEKNGWRFIDHTRNNGRSMSPTELYYTVDRYTRHTDDIERLIANGYIIQDNSPGECDEEEKERREEMLRTTQLNSYPWTRFFFTEKGKAAIRESYENFLRKGFEKAGFAGKESLDIFKTGEHA